jgi:hypothetical protein
MFIVVIFDLLDNKTAYLYTNAIGLSTYFSHVSCHIHEHKLVLIKIKFTAGFRGLWVTKFIL